MGAISSVRRRSAEADIDAALLEHGVGGVTRLNLAVNRDVSVGERAEPDVVIAFASADEPATVPGQEFAHSGLS